MSHDKHFLSWLCIHYIARLLICESTYLVSGLVAVVMSTSPVKWNEPSLALHTHVSCAVAKIPNYRPSGASGCHIWQICSLDKLTRIGK